jgi:hypothetical protein
MRQLPAQRERAVAVHPAGRVIDQPAKADNLQWHGIFAASAGVERGGTVWAPATLVGNDTDDGMHAMRVQLMRASLLVRAR